MKNMEDHHWFLLIVFIVSFVTMFRSMSNEIDKLRTIAEQCGYETRNLDDYGYMDEGGMR